MISCLRRQCFVRGGGDFLIRVLELIFEGIDFLKTINNKCFLLVHEKNKTQMDNMQMFIFNPKSGANEDDTWRQRSVTVHSFCTDWCYFTRMYKRLPSVVPYL